MKPNFSVCFKCSHFDVGPRDSGVVIVDKEPYTRMECGICNWYSHEEAPYWRGRNVFLRMYPDKTLIYNEIEVPPRCPYKLEHVLLNATNNRC